MPRRILVLAGLVGWAIGAAACDGEPIEPPAAADTTLTVAPRSLLLLQADTARLGATVATADGGTLAPPLTWVSRNPMVAPVSPDGLVTGAQAGIAWVVATALGRSDSAFVTVASPSALPALQLVSDRLSEPIHLTAPPGDSARLFVAEKTGAIRVFRDNVLLPDPFLDLADSVSDGSEQGLLSLAFHPEYADNGLVYVSYTDVGGDTRVVRYTVSATNPDQADPASASPVLFVVQPYTNHNGGLVAFGPDGMLYLGLGDGGLAGDPEDRAQNLDSLLGKMLRLDVDRGTPYAIPGDNPFADGASARPEIWAYGLRNPWRFSFDRLTGDLYVADVGQQSLEEVNVRPGASAGGENYGWRIMEGTACFNPSSGCSTAGLTLPVTEYAHSAGRCSVTGGHVYRGSALPILSGRYLYADYCTGEVWSFRYAGGTATEPVDWSATLDPGGRVTSFGEDARGELYVLTQGGGLYRIVPRTPPLAMK